MVDYETSSLHYQEYLFRCKDIMQYFYIKSIYFAVKISWQYFYIKSICFAVKISCNVFISSKFILLRRHPVMFPYPTCLLDQRHPMSDK